jgi:bla regulator protein BlaR1
MDVSTPVTDVSDKSVISFLQTNMPFVVAAWFLGALIFLLRTTGGWFYVSTLKKESVTINNQWSQLLNTLGYKIGVKRWVELASTTKLSAPVVLGYFKPIVLVPVGLFTGLTPAQVETVFLHELMHIKRNDYLVNLIQLILESIFFFNPFVWMISSMIRIEREHCCDDAVVAHHANPLDYAHALTKLEEERAQHPALALSFAGNKYYLLERIKRIMEKSAKNYSVRDRIVPVALLLVGLVCASWMIQPGEENETGTTDAIIQPCPLVCPLDTSKKEKSARYSIKTITTIDEDGKPQKQFIEEFEGDEDLHRALADEGLRHALAPGNIDLIMDFKVSGIPITDFNFPPMSFPDAPVPPMSFNYNLGLDSVPEFNSQWSIEFEKAFKEKFSDFYESHEKEINTMMKELNEKFQGEFNFNFNHENFSRELESQLREVDAQVRMSHDKILELQNNEEIQKHIMETMQRAQEFEEQATAHHKQRQEYEKDKMHYVEEHLKIMEEKMKEDENRLSNFESALRDELIKDGYLKKGESIKTINWHSTDGEDSLNVNGKEIKKSDTKKYLKIQNEYMQKKRSPITE